MQFRSLGIDQPEIAALRVQNVADFFGDHREQFVEFESGIENAAQIVKGREPFQSKELGMAFFLRG